jgi:hypothetical protein
MLTFLGNHEVVFFPTLFLVKVISDFIKVLRKKQTRRRLGNQTNTSPKRKQGTSIETSVENDRQVSRWIGLLLVPSELVSSASTCKVEWLDLLHKRGIITEILDVDS